MEKGERRNIGFHCGIARLDDDKGVGSFYVVYEDRYDKCGLFMSQGGLENVLGYVVSVGDTMEEALLKAVENLVNEKRKNQKIIKNLFDDYRNDSGDLVKMNSKGKIQYDVDPDCLYYNHEVNIKR